MMSGIKATPGVLSYRLRGTKVPEPTWWCSPPDEVSQIDQESCPMVLVYAESPIRCILEQSWAYIEGWSPQLIG